MELNELFNLLLPQLIPAILTVLGSFGLWLATQVVNLYKDNKNAALIEKIIKQTVDYVEQVSKNKEIADKKQLALDKALEFAQAKGIAISEVELDIMIEAFVNGIKKADSIVLDEPQGSE